MSGDEYSTSGSVLRTIIDVLSREALSLKSLERGDHCRLPAKMSP